MRVLLAGPPHDLASQHRPSVLRSIGMGVSSRYLSKAEGPRWSGLTRSVWLHARMTLPRWS